MRYDLALCDKKYLKKLISDHVSGQLKVAPEHNDEEVLALMGKPSFKTFLEFRNYSIKYQSPLIKNNIYHHAAGQGQLAHRLVTDRHVGEQQGLDLPKAQLLELARGRARLGISARW